MKMINRNNTKKGQEGFTLLEILVVMVIIGILVSIGIRSFTQSQMKTRDAKRKHDLEQIARALEMYYNDYGQYPADNNDGLMVLTDGAEVDWGEPFVDSNGTIYMATLPADPSGLSYYYEILNDDKSYYLYCFLENGQDQGITAEGGHASTDCGSEASADLDCNYAVSSADLPQPSLTPAP